VDVTGLLLDVPVFGLHADVAHADVRLGGRVGLAGLDLAARPTVQANPANTNCRAVAVAATASFSLP
jgi:hypothetical protein